MEFSTHIRHFVLKRLGSITMTSLGDLSSKIYSRESFSLEEVLSNGPRVEICVQKQLVCDVECGLCF